MNKPECSHCSNVATMYRYYFGGAIIYLCDECFDRIFIGEREEPTECTYCGNEINRDNCLYDDIGEAYCSRECIKRQKNCIDI